MDTGEARRVPGPFSYSPGSAGDAGPDDLITSVHLRQTDYGGPFWDDEGCIGDDWEVWEPLGLTRETFEACVAWSGAAGDGGDAERIRLTHRLRAELPAHIEVALFEGRGQRTSYPL